MTTPDNITISTAGTGMAMTMAMTTAARPVGQETRLDGAAGGSRFRSYARQE